MRIGYAGYVDSNPDVRNIKNAGLGVEVCWVVALNEGNKALEMISTQPVDVLVLRPQWPVSSKIRNALVELGLSPIIIESISAQTEIRKAISGAS